MTKTLVYKISTDPTVIDRFKAPDMTRFEKNHIFDDYAAFFNVV